MMGPLGNMVAVKNFFLKFSRKWAELLWHELHRCQAKGSSIFVTTGNITLCCSQATGFAGLLDTCSHAIFLPHLIFDTEDKGNTFL
jgi:hypothetical protein